MFTKITEAIEILKNDKTRKPSKPMNQSQPTFSGKDTESIDNWIFTTNTNMDAANIPQDERLNVAVGYLRKRALQAFRQIAKPETTWLHLQQELREDSRDTISKKT